MTMSLASVSIKNEDMCKSNPKVTTQMESTCTQPCGLHRQHFLYFIPLLTSRTESAAWRNPECLPKHLLLLARCCWSIRLFSSVDPFLFITECLLRMFRKICSVLVTMGGYLLVRMSYLKCKRRVSGLTNSRYLFIREASCQCCLCLPMSSLPAVGFCMLSVSVLETVQFFSQVQCAWFKAVFRGQMQAFGIRIHKQLKLVFALGSARICLWAATGMWTCPSAANMWWLILSG